MKNALICLLWFIIAAVWFALVGGPWWLIGPETFWQRFIFALFDGCWGTLTAVGLVFFGIWATCEIIDWQP